VGQPHQGLAQMFHMMNEARIGVGLGAIMLGTAGYRYSLQYAKERKQGRHPDQKDPASPPVVIVEHADVRRMLLQQKAYTEGALGLAVYAATLVDVQAQDPDPARGREAHLLLELLTPVVKAWSADWCLKSNDLAIQVLGGYGYTREYPVEQYWRDNRLNPIHEGANGIQGLDLLGRKVLMHDGVAFKLLAARMLATAHVALPHDTLAAPARQLQSALQTLESATRAAWINGQPEEALANATPYLQAFGHVVLAWLWLDVGLACEARLSAASADAGTLAPLQGRLAAMRYFYAFELPKTDAWLLPVAARQAVCREMRDAWF
jgi:butyryl-CoA dehydrogenase